MPLSTTPTRVFCPAGVFTPVAFYFGAIPIGNLWFAPGATVSWRMSSSGAPFRWVGTFTGRACVRPGIGLITLLEFNPNISVTVTALTASC